MSWYDLEIHSSSPPYGKDTLRKLERLRCLCHASGASCGEAAGAAGPAMPEEGGEALAADEDGRTLGPAELWHEIERTCLRLEPDEATYFAASWYHPVMGYDANYYGYLWADVNAHDCFSVFAASPNGCLDEGAGMRLRKCLLEPGATLPAGKMLRRFLGRDPNSGAFLKMLSS
jgi:hypothetical protein